MFKKQFLKVYDPIFVTNDVTEFFMELLLLHDWRSGCHFQYLYKQPARCIASSSPYHINV
jgi:hypothetical protein